MSEESISFIDDWVSRGCPSGDLDYQAVLADDYLNSLPKRRIDAIRLEAPRFFTGQPCNNGHLSWRQTRNGRCSKCACESAARSRVADPIRARLACVKYYARHNGAARMAEYRANMTDAEREEVKVRKRDARKNFVLSDPVWRWTLDAASASRVRAKRKDIPHSITKEYIRSICVTHCPALGIELVYCNPEKIAWNSAQLDRIKPALGYVEGNVQVISKRANVVKNDATFDEISKIYHWLLAVK